MSNALSKFMICIVVGTLMFVPGSIAQVRKRSVCGKVILNTTAEAKSQVSLYFTDGALLPGAATERDGTFCIENYVSDLSKSTSAHLYVASFCRPDDVALVNVPFWPRLRREPRFAGKHIIVGPGSLTSVGDVDVQLIYGHVSLKILDQRHRPLLTKLGDWSSVWIRVQDHNGVTVHESGLSAVEIERSVHLNESSIDLALPNGKWTLDVALAGVPPGTPMIRRPVPWRRVPSQLKIESCRDPLEVKLVVRRKRRS